MAKSRSDNFFSVGFTLIICDTELPYDLYVNSSSLKDRERFVRIFKGGDFLEKSELKNFGKKYHQLYILESQRGQYLKTLVKNDNVGDVEKSTIIKDSAISYLSKIFDGEKKFTTELLGKSVEGCRDSVESMIDVVHDYSIQDIQKLIGDLSYHDFYTYDHSINVSMYCISIYKALRPNAPREDLIMAGMGGLLHDLGKIKIPTRIINNPGDLSDEDFKMIGQHPRFGLELLTEDQVHACNCPDVDFEIIKRVVYEHHENYNGTGYPEKISGKDIHVMARVCAIADFFDAITSKRSYHEVLSTQDALEVMSRSVGKKIDPKIFEVFTKNMNVVLKGKSNKEMDDSFDACRPMRKLPLKEVTAKIQEKDFFKKEEQDFGKITANDFNKRKAS